MTRFEFAWADGYRPAAGVFGVFPRNSWVEVRDGELRARFGIWSLRTPLSNIERAEITGPYRYYRTAGPARLGVTDGGLTYATNGERGVEITFRRRVRSGGPTTFLLHHPALTVTVADCQGLVDALQGAERV